VCGLQQGTVLLYMKGRTRERERKVLRMSKKEAMQRVREVMATLRGTHVGKDGGRSKRGGKRGVLKLQKTRRRRIREGFLDATPDPPKARPKNFNKFGSPMEATPSPRVLRAQNGTQREASPSPP
jgi:hypothetical protein